ncbi:hypothetical protein ACH42_16045 [Endozoicomonas sp. (ex Bugula neritina AB1)]|nr:hypothetical protein ACH42_16045 [Endozoicomonas sp. (ex Bugula neritina AB1)]
MKKIRVQGFTLVELLVAITLSLILLISISEIYLNTVVAQRTNDSRNELTHEARIALTLITQDIGSIGFAGGAPFSSVDGNGLVLNNDCTGLASASNTTVGIMAGQSTANNILDCVANAAIGNYTPNDGSPSDWLLFKGAIGPEIPRASLENNIAYLISNPLEGTLFQGQNPPLLPNGRIREYRFNLFYRTTNNDLTLLEINGGRLTPRVLATGVSQIRIRLGLSNTPSDSQINQWVTAPNNASAQSHQYWNRVRAIEIHLLSRGRQAPNFSDNKEYDVGGIIVRGNNSNEPGNLSTQTAFLYNQSYRQAL